MLSDFEVMEILVLLPHVVVNPPDGSGVVSYLRYKLEEIAIQNPIQAIFCIWLTVHNFVVIPYLRV